MGVGWGGVGWGGVGVRSGRRRVCTLHGGMGGGVGRGRDGRGVAEGYAPCLGVGYCRKVVFEGLSRGVRGDALACRGHPYMFYFYVFFSTKSFIE